MRRRAFLLGTSASVVASSGVCRLASSQPVGGEAPAGFTVLHVTEGEITIGGQTAKAYSLRQGDGTYGYEGVKGGRFQVALDNGAAGPISVHWHGLILPNGQDGVPYVTQRPIEAGAPRIYESVANSSTLAPFRRRSPRPWAPFR